MKSYLLRLTQQEVEAQFAPQRKVDVLRVALSGRWRARKPAGEAARAPCLAHVRPGEAQLGVSLGRKRAAPLRALVVRRHHVGIEERRRPRPRTQGTRGREPKTLQERLDRSALRHQRDEP